MIYLLGIFVLVLSWILPWWGFCAISFLLGHKSKSALNAFVAGFVSVFFVWLIVSYIQNMQSHGLMTEKMSALFSLPHPLAMLFVNAVFGGMLAGIWCLSGYWLHQILSKQKVS